MQAYNEKKVKLEESIKDLNKRIETTRTTTQYDAIEEESRKLAERQEWIYKIVGTVAIVGVLFTVYRIR
jgi:uncharacterized protein YlxW (UPF0749 family)